LHTGATAQQPNMFPSLTGIVTKLFYVGMASGLAYIGGELLVKGGVLAAIVGGLVALGVEGLRTLVAFRKSKLEEFAAIKQALEALHEEEKSFWQSQITYFEALEKVNRERIHTVFGELQRCNAYIRTCNEIARLHICGGDILVLPAFQAKSYDELTSAHPLPEPPER